MDEAPRREILINAGALAAYLERGYELEWIEPPVRGRRGGPTGVLAGGV